MPAQLDPVDELSLFLVSQPLAGELPCVRPDRANLGLEPRLADVGKERLGVLDERRRVAWLLRLDALGELIRAVEGVDELVGVLPEPQPELDIALNVVLHRRILRRTIALR